MLIAVLSGLLLAACGSTEEQLRQRAAELCQYIPDLSEAVRREQLYDYLRRHHLNVHYYQDYGWDAVEITK